MTHSEFDEHPLASKTPLHPTSRRVHPNAIVDATSGDTLLHIAAREADAATVRLLLKLRADPFFRNVRWGLDRLADSLDRPDRRPSAYVYGSGRVGMRLRRPRRWVTPMWLSCWRPWAFVWTREGIHESPVLGLQVCDGSKADPELIYTDIYMRSLEMQ